MTRTAPGLWKVAVLAVSALASVAVAGLGCGGGFKAQWKGSGEVGEGRFFQFLMDTKREVPAAAFQYAGVEQTAVAICDIRQQEQHVEFRMDPDSGAKTCDALRTAYLFVGDYGRDVVTGQVLDASGRRVGLFRAFRVPD